MRSHSFFLFGARGTGKSTWVQSTFPDSHYVNLLEDRWEDRYLRNPDLLIDDIAALPKKPDWIVIDEVQKIPKLLDIAHHQIEANKLKFILTASSAKKFFKSSS